jgi:hypothetical protein
MKGRRGKAVAFWSVILGLAVLLAGVVFFKDHLLRPYWLWKLKSDDIDEQEAAVRKLTEIGCFRPVLEAIVHDPGTRGGLLRPTTVIQVDRRNLVLAQKFVAELREYPFMLLK